MPAPSALAGALLPNATKDQIKATTFNRLHPQKVEGGSVPEEFRIEYGADVQRVSRAGSLVRLQVVGASGERASTTCATRRTRFGCATSRSIT